MLYDIGNWKFSPILDRFLFDGGSHYFYFGNEKRVDKMINLSFDTEPSVPDVYLYIVLIWSAQSYPIVWAQNITRPLVVDSAVCVKDQNRKVID